MTREASFLKFTDRLRRFMVQALAGEIASNEKAEAQINPLALELFALQHQWNAPYRKWCEALGRSPANTSHWSGIPAVPVAAFKDLEMTSLSVAERTRVFHSSGTTGQRPSRHFHHRDSLALYEASLIPWFQKHLLPEWDGAGEGIFSEAGTRVRFLVLTPPLVKAPRSSLVHMFATVVEQFGASASVFCGAVRTDGAWAVNQDAAELFLRQASECRQAVVVMGTAFNFVHLLDGMTGHGERITLPPGSCVLETGGYKGRSRALSKSDLHALLADRLGILSDRSVSEYGMSELSSQAYDRVLGASRPTPHAPRPFRFPLWARVQVISPETGREVAEGETGLLRLFDLANVWSVQAVQTEDLAIRRADGFELLGRAAAAEPRGCSLMAVEA
jgi:hypothetical protein